MEDRHRAKFCSQCGSRFLGVENYCASCGVQVAEMQSHILPLSQVTVENSNSTLYASNVSEEIARPKLFEEKIEVVVDYLTIVFMWYAIYLIVFTDDIFESIGIEEFVEMGFMAVLLLIAVDVVKKVILWTIQSIR